MDAKIRHVGIVVLDEDHVLDEDRKALIGSSNDRIGTSPRRQRESHCL
jgi:hypothetical protein